MEKKIIGMLDFYAKLAPNYDYMAKMLPSFPPATLVYNEIKPELGHDIRTIVDIGIGTGLSSKPFVGTGRTVTGVDGSEDMLQLCAKKRIAQTLLRVDFTKACLPFEPEQFDAAISASTLYTLPERNQEMIIEEMHRITKRGGLFAFNYEVRKQGNPAVRLNDATFSGSPPCGVETYSLFPEQMRDCLAKNPSDLLRSSTKVVAKKWDGYPIVFETMVCRRL